MDKIFSNFVYIASLLFTVSMGGLLFPSAGWASCGSSNCFLVVGTQEGVIVPGQVILDLSYRFIPMDLVQEGSKSASEALVPKIDFENGMMRIPDAPGLGIDINEEELAKHPYQPHNLRHYTGALTEIRPKNSEGWYKEKRVDG